MTMSSLVVLSVLLALEAALPCSPGATAPRSLTEWAAAYTSLTQYQLSSHWLGVNIHSLLMEPRHVFLTITCYHKTSLPMCPSSLQCVTEIPPSKKVTLLQS